MLRLRTLIVCLSFTVCLAASAANPLLDGPWPMLPAGQAPSEGERWGRLDNGFRYVAAPSGEGDEVTSLRLMVAAGRAHEPAGKAGLAQVLSQLMFERTSGFDRDELAAFGLRNGMRFQNGGFSEVDLFHTIYKLDLDHATDGALEEAMRFLAEVAGAPSFDADLVATQRQLVAANASRGLALYATEGMRRERRLYRDSPYSKLDDSQIADQAPTIEASDLRAYWERWYRAEGMALIVTGDVDAEAVEALAREHFAGLAGGYERLKRSDPGKLIGGGEVETLASDSAFSQVSLSQVSEPVNLYDGEQERRYYELDLLGRYGQQLAFGSEWLGPDATYVHRGRVVTTLGRRGSVIGLQDYLRMADKAAHRLHEFGVRAEDLAELKPEWRALATSYDLDWSAREWPPLMADRLVRSAAEGIPFRRGSELKRYLDAVVDALTVERAAERCEATFRPKDLIYAIELPEGFSLKDRMIAKRLKAMRKGYDYTWERAGEVPRNWNLGTGFQSSGVVESTDLMDLGPHKVLRYVFRNKARVNLLRTDQMPGKALMRLSMGNGMADLERGNAAFSALARAAIPKMQVGQGPEALGMRELLEGPGLEQVEAGANLEQLYWSATGSKEGHVHDFLSATLLWMVTSRLSEEAFDEEVEALRNTVSSENAVSLPRRLDELLFPEDPRLRGSYTEEDVDALSYEAFNRWLQQAREEGYIELTIVGDVEPRGVLRDVRKTFGSAPDRKGKVIQPRHGKPAQLGEAGMASDTVETSVSDGYVSIFWPQVEPKSCESELRLRALEALFSEHAARTMEAEPKLLSALSVSLIGEDMVPGSRAIKLELRCPPELSERAELLAAEAGRTFAEALTPELIAAAERLVWVDLQAATRSTSRMVALLDQSQGRPNELACVLAAMAEGVSFDPASYVELARNQFSDTNAHGVALMPAGK